MVNLTVKGGKDFLKTDTFFQRVLEKIKLSSLDNWGRKGVAALRSATPVDTGKTAESWSYRIERNKEGVRLIWYNTNINKGVNIALIIQYGHVARNGVYIRGRDYINPALSPIFKEIEDAAWKEVKDA